MLSKIFENQGKNVLLLAEDVAGIIVNGENASRKSLEPMTILRKNEADVKDAMSRDSSTQFILDQLAKIMSG